MVKVFTPNKNGKIEFTKKELEELLNEVWRNGYNSNYSWTWTSPWYGGTTYCNTTASPITTDKWTITTSNVDDKITLTDSNIKINVGE